MASSAVTYSFTIEAMIRGYHVYKSIWTARRVSMYTWTYTSLYGLREEFRCIREDGNSFAVAVVKADDTTIPVRFRVYPPFSCSRVTGCRGVARNINRGFPKSQACKCLEKFWWPRPLPVPHPPNFGNTLVLLGLHALFWSQQLSQALAVASCQSLLSNSCTTSIVETKALPANCLFGFCQTH